MKFLAYMIIITGVATVFFAIFAIIAKTWETITMAVVLGHLCAFSIVVHDELEKLHNKKK